MKKKSSLIQILLPVLMMLVSPLIWGQTPENFGWYSQEPVAMTKSQCFNKAIEALRSSGLSDLKTQDEWTAGASNYNMRAGIACVTCGEGVVISVSVAATYGYTKAGEMRDYLRNYMLGGTSIADETGYQDIGGVWICQVYCPAGGVGSEARIVQNGNDLIVYNEAGSKSLGTLSSPNIINISGSSLSGKIGDQGKKIEWSNGTVWGR